jgi:preprotein translocase subunit SecG
MAILSGFLLVVLFVSAVLLVIIVLMQDEQGEGLGGIFGGGGATPVGNRSGNILTKATSIIAIVFLSTVLAYAWINRTPDQSNVEAAAREAEGETFLEWWATDEPVDLPGDVVEPEAEMEAADESESDNGDDSETENESE